jgi:(1->4)-alpha-D-glucan 1-alpha-D-glucosylmutase
MLRRWSLLNRSGRVDLEGAPAPSPGDEYLYYQSLLGIWPASPPDAAELQSLRERLSAYMLKAVKEAKVHTSWINPDAQYEQALERFVAQSLDNPLFLKDVNEVVPRIAHLGVLVGLSQALVKAVAPGVPDYYQGTEIWDFSLVDPDNRRPVDYAKRKSLLQNLPSDARGLIENLADGRAKLHVIRRALKLRKEKPELFYSPTYTPLYADAGKEENICAFTLGNGPELIAAVAPRLFAAMVPDARSAPLGAVWGESRLPLPPGSYENVLTGEKHEVADRGILLADLLAAFPVALLVAR